MSGRRVRVSGAAVVVAALLLVSGVGQPGPVRAGAEPDDDGDCLVFPRSWDCARYCLHQLVDVFCDHATPPAEFCALHPEYQRCPGRRDRH